MRPSDTLASNLKKFFEAEQLTTNGVATQSGVSQKTIWVCINGTVAPSVNVADAVAKSVGRDAFSLCRGEFDPEQIKNCNKVGAIADKLMQLPVDKLRMIDEMVTGLLKA